MKIKGYHNATFLKSVQLLAWLTIPFVIVFSHLFSLVPFLLGVLFITSLGSSAGLHRYFGHKSFKTGKLRHWFLAFVTTLSTQGSIALWVVYHGEHHKNADTPDDPIAPNHAGFLKAFFAIQDVADYKGVRPRHVAQELKDPAVKFFHDWYWPTIFLYILVLGLIDITLIINLYLLPVVLVRIIFGVQNTFGHGYPNIDGYKNYDTFDNSVNSPLVNVFTFFLGETLHNNHHSNPSLYYYRHKWWEIDATGWMIKMFFAK